MEKDPEFDIAKRDSIDNATSLAAAPPEKRPMSLGQFRMRNKPVDTGIVIMGAVALAAGLAAALVLFNIGLGMGAVAVVSGALGVMGAVGYLQQQRKKVLNQYHAYRSYPKTEGYHREPEYIQDKSLVHQIQGPSDLKERVKYIETHYNMKLRSPGQVKAPYQLAGSVVALGVGMGTGLGLAALFGPPAFAFALCMGILAGGVTLAIAAAHSTRKYDKYVDRMAAKGKEKQLQQSRIDHQAPEQTPAQTTAPEHTNTPDATTQNASEQPRQMVADTTPQHVMIDGPVVHVMGPPQVHIVQQSPQVVSFATQYAAPQPQTSWQERTGADPEQTTIVTR